MLSNLTSIGDCPNEIDMFWFTAINLPGIASVDEYLLDFSATRGTVMVTSSKSDDNMVTHSVYDLAKKDEGGEEENDDDGDEEDSEEYF